MESATKTETILKEIHPKDLWYPLRSQIEGRAIIIHGGYGEPVDGFQMTKLTFEPPLTVNGQKMMSHMFMNCKHETRNDVFETMAESFKPVNI